MTKIKNRAEILKAVKQDPSVTDKTFEEIFRRNMEKTGIGNSDQMEEYQTFAKDREIILEGIKHDFKYFKSAHNSLKEDRQFVLAQLISVAPYLNTLK